MSDATYHVTGEDLRKMEGQESKAHGGQINKESDVAILKQIISERDNEQERIDKAQANLPLPDDPVGGKGKAPPPDFNSADARTVNVGSGGVNVKLGTQSSSGLREPATAESGARVDGEEYKANTV